MSALTDITNHMSNPQAPLPQHGTANGSAQNGSALSSEKAGISQSAPISTGGAPAASGEAYPTYSQDAAAITAPQSATSTTAPQSALSATAPQSALSNGTAPTTGNEPSVAAAAASPTSASAAEPTAVSNAPPAAAAPVTGSQISTGTNNGSAAPVATVNPMKAKDVKKYDKLLQKEQKDEEKQMAVALNDAKTAEKALAKSKKAEAQAIKRFNKAAKEEHKANKKFERAQTAHLKVLADKDRLAKEVEIKKQHSATTGEAYEKAKQTVDSTRQANAASATTRAQRQAEIHGTPGPN